MNREWIYRIKWARPNHRAMIGVFVAIAILVTLGTWSLQRAAASALAPLFDRIAAKTGLQVLYHEQDLSLSSLELRDVSIAAVPSLHAASARGDLSLNPFSANFLKLTHVTIRGLSLTTDFNDPLVTKMKNAVAPIMGGGLQAPDRETVATDKLGDLSRVVADDLTITLTDGNIAIRTASAQEPISIHGLEAALDARSRSVRYEASSIILPPSQLFTNMKGVISQTSDGEWSLKGEGSRHETDNPWRFHVLVSHTAGKDLSGTFDLSGLPPTLSNRIDAFIPDSKGLEISGDFSLQSPAEDTLTIAVNAHFSPFHLRHSLLSEDSVGPFVPQLKLNASLHKKSRKVEVHKAIATLLSPFVRPSAGFQGVQIGLSLTGDLNPESGPYGRWSGIVKIPQTSCQAAIDVAPLTLLPEIKEFALSGQFNVDADVRLDSSAPDQFYFVPTSNTFTCRTTTSPHEFSRERLAGPFTIKRETEDGTNREFNLDSRSPTFAPIGSISPNMLMAVVASEDAGFWSNSGVDFGAIQFALRNNLKNDKVLAGGSTITMQLVKNLFLNRRKTLVRKLQEVLLAWHLSHTLNKDRILELYLNVIEFGPNIFGIVQAAHHFFGKDPATLDLKESAYLASVLPSPLKRYHQFCTGRLTPAYEELLDEKLAQMHSQGRISFETMETARNLPLNFGPSQPRNRKECQDRIESADTF